MAHVELITPDGRREAYPSDKRSIGVDSANVPVVKHGAGDSLIHSLAEVGPSPHLVAMQASEPPGRSLVAHRVTWSKKVS